MEKRRGGGSKKPAGSSIPIDVAAAERDGLLAIIDHLRPDYAAKVWRWRHRLNDEFAQRTQRAVTNSQIVRLRRWYLGALRHPRLPDLRAGRSFDSDLGLISQYGALRQKLRAIFREQPSPAQRSKAAATFAKHRFKIAVASDSLQPLKTSAQYAYEILHTDAVQLSRAKRRLVRVLDANLPQALRALQQLQRSAASPGTIRRAQRAAAFLTGVVLPQLRRSK